MNNTEKRVDELFEEATKTIAFSAAKGMEHTCVCSNQIPIIKFVLTHPLAKLPTKAHPEDACYDIYGLEEVTLKPHEVRLFKTGLIPGIPKGWKMEIVPRSGLALKAWISVQNTPGTIDAPYRGEIGVILRNDSDEPYEFHLHDRIAQCSFDKVEEVKLIEVEILEDTDRGESGFGGSGR